jgi:hypothetical protein
MTEGAPLGNCLAPPGGVAVFESVVEQPIKLHEAQLGVTILANLTRPIDLECCTR